MTGLHDQWLIHQFTEGKDMLLDAWSQLSEENIKSFQSCGLSLANDAREDDLIPCLKKGQPGRARRKKTNSQISILVDQSRAINPFISPSDEEDANEEINMIEDEKDEENIM